MANTFKFGRVKPSTRSDSIIIPPGVNKYGYRVNINHPLVRPIYEEWKRERHIMIPSDAERHHFEIYIQLLIDHGKLPKK